MRRLSPNSSQTCGGSLLRSSCLSSEYSCVPVKLGIFLRNGKPLHSLEPSLVGGGQGGNRI